ncbi:MAG: hypothetical protein AB2A00_34210 [Myxococcota bacterium]
MKAKQLPEVREIVNSELFRSWFDALTKARLAAREASLRHDEVLTQVHLMEFRAELAQKKAMDALYRSGDYENASAQMQAEASELENKSLEVVGQFEKQRVMCTELWVALTKAEEQNDPRAKRIKDDYERETAKKTLLWEEVESLWAASLAKNLAMIENRAKGKRVRKESEQLFANAEQGSRSAAALKAETQESARALEQAEEAVRDLMNKGRTQFDAVVHEDFLYWAARENKLVYVVPLFSDSEHYNIELTACTVYQCERTRGVEFLEPVMEPQKATRVDTRLDDFFLKDRPKVKREKQDA